MEVVEGWLLCLSRFDIPKRKWHISKKYFIDETIAFEHFHAVGDSTVHFKKVISGVPLLKVGDRYFPLPNPIEVIR